MVENQKLEIDFAIEKQSNGGNAEQVNFHGAVTYLILKIFKKKNLK